jgi:hypothetical protein
MAVQQLVPHAEPGHHGMRLQGAPGASDYCLYVFAVWTWAHVCSATGIFAFALRCTLMRERLCHAVRSELLPALGRLRFADHGCDCCFALDTGHLQVATCMTAADTTAKQRASL